MVQKSSEFSTQQLGQQLALTLGQALCEQELSNCIKLLEIQKPSAGKLFWQTQDATVGIYIILAGKVRLLDRTDNLIAQGGAGASFGELTLFPEEQFQPYAARASVNLKLCYVPGDCLRSLIRKYPSIREHLHHGAVHWDLLLRESKQGSRDVGAGFTKDASISQITSINPPSSELGRIPTVAPPPTTYPTSVKRKNQKKIPSVNFPLIRLPEQETKAVPTVH